MPALPPMHAALRHGPRRNPHRLGLFSNVIWFSAGCASKALGAADRGHEKTPARVPARGTLGELEFPEQLVPVIRINSEMMMDHLTLGG
jgi:hypothetical protein